MAKYARGKHAYGFCDRTGVRYPLSDLVYEFVDGRRTGLRVGFDQVDPDHPQNRVGQVSNADAQSLFDAAPDTSIESLFGFAPVGNAAQYLRINDGRVTVTTS